jgi:hypothetical protein
VFPFAGTGGAVLAGRLEGLGKLVRWGFTREELPPAPPQAPATARPSLFRALLGTESLPEAPPEPSGGRPALLAVLFARESLPLDPERKHIHRSWLSFLLARERIDPPGGAGPEVH